MPMQTKSGGMHPSLADEGNNALISPVTVLPISFIYCSERIVKIQPDYLPAKLPPVNLLTRALITPGEIFKTSIKCIA